MPLANPKSTLRAVEHSPDSILRKGWKVLGRAAKTFLGIDGTQRAGAFAHYAFFSLFPAIILFVAVASLFVERERAATEIIGFLEGYVPMGSKSRSFIFDTLTGVVETRGRASALAIALLCWSVMRFIGTLIRATNRAWGSEVHNWWRLPVKSLLFLVVVLAMIPLGIALPVIMKTLQGSLVSHAEFSAWIYSLAAFALRVGVLFLGLAIFYRMAPRRKTSFNEVWAATAITTALLVAVQALFGLYLQHFGTLNFVYGTFGGVMAMLLWIYLSGCVFIFGACLCAAGAAAGDPPAHLKDE
jgi:YihY family inner membrane protein